ncbi:MAG: hypothetical protein ACLPPF_18290 [Rhodomicrobium sp.]
MDIAITVTAAPASEDLLLDAAAALQRDFGGALEFRWLAPGEAVKRAIQSCAAHSAFGKRGQDAEAVGCAGVDAAAGGAAPMLLPLGIAALDLL